MMVPMNTNLSEFIQLFPYKVVLAARKERTLKVINFILTTAVTI